MSVKDSSKEFGVSEQSIRNFIRLYPLEIKTTYIGGRVLIETESLMNLLENHAIKTGAN
ncbi:MAG: hypothetical protein K6G31_04480 [Paludibacteraceae bacterium]|nr:hypothetical protein [Paludibacteraceae bacterium]